MKCGGWGKDKEKREGRKGSATDWNVKAKVRKVREEKEAEASRAQGEKVKADFSVDLSGRPPLCRPAPVVRPALRLSA